jgi:fatty acid synthase
MESRQVDVELLQLFYDIHKTEIDGNLYRGYTIVPAKSWFPPESCKQEIVFTTGIPREVWWIFSGMGSQWVGMGLYSRN